MASTITMYDSTNVSSLPAGKAAYAGYIGPYGPINRIVTFPALAKRFYPRAHLLSVAAQSYLIAACLDVETGDATPGDVPAWYRLVKAHGQERPCFYAAEDNGMAAVMGELHEMGLPRSAYRLWVADFDGVAEVPAAYDAKQYRGGIDVPFDVSVCRADFFEAPAAAKPKKARVIRDHPKTTGATGGAALGAGITALLHAVGVKIDPEEASAISTIGAALTGTLTPARRP